MYTDLSDALFDETDVLFRMYFDRHTIPYETSSVVYCKSLENDEIAQIGPDGRLIESDTTISLGSILSSLYKRRMFYMLNRSERIMNHICQHDISHEFSDIVSVCVYDVPTIALSLLSVGFCD